VEVLSAQREQLLAALDELTASSSNPAAIEAAEARAAQATAAAEARVGDALAEADRARKALEEKETALAEACQVIVFLGGRVLFVIVAG
jgi:hypothetical protein